MDAWLPGIPRYPNTAILNPANLLIPRGVVTHRTLGNWAGDLSVLTRIRVPSCHYLVGKLEGQWGQLVPNGVVANHAAGANSYALGIEVSGQNGEPMTPWQLTACSRIVNWLITSGIPKNRYRGTERVSRWDGFIDHAFVACAPKDEHHDYWNPRDWDTIAGLPRGADDDVLTKDESTALRSLSAAINQGQPSILLDIRNQNAQIIDLLTKLVEK